MAERDQRLKELYYTASDPGSYGGVERLYRRAREAGLSDIKREDVRDFLTNQHSYSVHKPARKRFRRNKIVVGGIDHQWQADLADMQAVAKDNDGYRYLLTVLDVFSKYAWVVPVKAKKAADMANAFRELFRAAHPRKPRRLQTDKGTEFYNKPVKDVLQQEGVQLFSSASDQKAAAVERFNRTIKSRIWTYFTAKRTYRYLDVLQDLVDAYNHSVHRSIKMRPVDVRTENENQVWVTLYGDGGRASGTTPIPTEKKVRVSRVKGNFEKGYLPNWSHEHFTVKSTRDGPRRVYKLADYLGEDIEGSWYPEELQPIDDNVYYVEKVLRRRKAPDGTKELLVKWEGWPAKFNSWIPEANVYDA